MGWQGADERAQALSAACELQAQRGLEWTSVSPGWEAEVRKRSQMAASQSHYVVSNTCCRLSCTNRISEGPNN